MMITSAITISIILQPMAAKAMEIIKDKGLAIGRYIAGTAVDKVTGRAIDNAIDMAVDKVDGIVNIERDISNLQTTLCMIQDILQVADKKQIDYVFIRNWLQDLVDIGYEARDVLDDFNTFSSCVIKAGGETSDLVNFISSFMLSYFGGSSSDTSKLPLSVLNRLANDIKSVRVRFDDMTKKGETFTKLKSVVGGVCSESVREYRRTEVGPSINKQGANLVLGREEMKQGIMEKILHPSDDNDVHVVAIWGMGGIGKTTLAQSIYNDERVKEDDYPTGSRSWLCVGENNFSAKEIIKEIVNEQNTIGIGNLQTKLKQKFKGNRFLIVLDDVWDVDGSEWELLFNPLTDDVGKGGLIIITTRKREVCTVTNTQKTYDLQPLSEEDSWSIFESYAYVNGKSDSTPDLKGIGEEIVKKLNGLPLALKVVGRSLLGKDSSTWTNFLVSNLTKDVEVMSALRWSYNHLPPHLKMCFTYCALFPKDHVFDNEKVLVEMWMAHDLIQKQEQERPEDVGAQYFEELVNASLLQCVDGKYVMHDMIHDLALLVSNVEFSSAVGSLSTDQMKKVRHITITNDDEYSKNLSLCKSKRILTVYTPYKWDHCLQTSILEKDILLEVFKQSKSLRVLVLCNEGMKEIPECICELKRLRYLDVSGTEVKSLPDSLCQLHNLQMLAAPLDASLPLDIVNIRSLRHVRATLPTCRGVAKLTSLQELSSILVCKGDNIRELGDMERLCGKLKIEGLENATSSEDFAGALMGKQTRMDELELVFNQHSAEPTISEEVLDALGCPPNLKFLKIYGYTGVKPPSWMVDGKHKFDKLRSLELFNCPKLESLPLLGELTSLKRLHLQNVGVKRLGKEFYGNFTDDKVFFPSLESLSFLEMKEWKEGDDIIIENASVSFFPRLKELELIKCPKLESLPPLGQLTSLKYLSLWELGVRRLGKEFYGKFTDSKVFFPSLKLLSFFYMEEWEGWVDIIIENSSVSFFPRLKELELINCPKLESLPLLGELTSLKRLHLQNVGVKRLGKEFYGNFTDGKVFFPSLESLSFLEMKEWKEGDDIIIENASVSFFPRLKELELINCPKLESLPPLVELTSLKRLHLQNVGVKRLGKEFYGKFTDSKVFFPSLKLLSFFDMKEWEGWDDIIIENSSVSFFPRLKELKLINCPKLKSLPALVELTSLKRLHLQNVGVKRLGDEFYGKFTDSKVFFPSLKLLSFFDMEEWEGWVDIIIENSSVSFFPRLKELKLINCPKLKSLPALVELTSLKRLHLQNVGVKRLGNEFYGKFTNNKVFFPSLKLLSFFDMKEWEGWDDTIIDNASMSFFPRLKELELINCPKLESLPPLVELTSLKRLHLQNVGVKRLGDEFYGKFTDSKVFFPSLESLSFLEMKEWEEWDDIIIENASVSFFPRLTKLLIVNCEKLVSVLPVVKNPIMNAANFMTSLSRLKISDCNGLKRLQLDALVSLEELELFNCPKLESLPPLVELTSLKRLHLQNVGVKRLGDEFYGKFTDSKVFFPSLESLSFYDMEEWEEWDEINIENSSVSFFPRLTELEINGCPKLVSVLPVVKNPIMNAANFITSLSRLGISYCKGLRSLPADGLHDISLRRLTIRGCPLLYERYNDESGTDRHKINHIPNKDISLLDD